MKAYRINFDTLIAISNIIAIGFYTILILLFSDTERTSILEILLHYGFVVLPVSLFLFIFNKYLWYQPWFFNTFGKSFNLPPDLRGRWEGILVRNGDSREFPMIIEIHQTLRNVKVFTYSQSNNSVSESYFSVITTDESEIKFSICYHWKGEADGIRNVEIPAAIFYGFTRLDLNNLPNPKELNGKYFTDRSPVQTKGDIKLKWTGFEYKGKA